MTTHVRRGSAEAKNIPHTRLEEESMIWEYYECGQKLGQGAFGKVYQARHKETDVQWAIKTVNKEKAGTSAIKLLEREVLILKKVHHENIIRLNEVFETSKRMYLVMELCEGGELADALKDKKFFTESEVKAITKELASAISYLHKNDIVHRDIKLENILLNKDPAKCDRAEKLQIKVTDFGLSVVKGGVGHDSMMQDFCGTPNYMAPEIIDNKTYSQQCDVWAMGVIVYALFCGNYPFRSKDEDTLYDLIKKGEIDFTDEHWNEVSADAKNCIQGMLTVDPAHRLTASEVQDHAWIAGHQRESMNVLQMMKEWKDDLKNEVGEHSAINGDIDSTDAKDDSAENHTDAAKENSSSKASEEEMPRKGSEGKIKPGSGGKDGKTSKSSRNSLTSTAPKTVSNQKASTGNAGSGGLKVSNANSSRQGSKSPAPTSRLTAPNQTPVSRQTPSNMVRPSPTPYSKSQNNTSGLQGTKQPVAKGKVTKK